MGGVRQPGRSSPRVVGAELRQLVRGPALPVAFEGPELPEPVDDPDLDAQLEGTEGIEAAPTGTSTTEPPPDPGPPAALAGAELPDLDQPPADPKVDGAALEAPELPANLADTPEAWAAFLDSAPWLSPAADASSLAPTSRPLAFCNPASPSAATLSACAASRFTLSASSAAWVISSWACAFAAGACREASRSARAAASSSLIVGVDSPQAFAQAATWPRGSFPLRKAAR